MSRRVFNKTQEKEIVKLYVKEKLSLKKIAPLFNKGTSTIHNVLIRHNIPLRKMSEAKQVYKFNEHYFDNINTKDKAYFLGFLFADGCNINGEIVFSLKIEDKYMVELYKKYIESTHPIKEITVNHDGKYYTCAKFNICNKHLSSQLNSIGLVPAKSLILEFPKYLTKELLSHFIRGYFDGDGCLYIGHVKGYRQNIRPSVSILSTENFLVDMSKYIEENIGVIGNIKKDSRSKAFVYKLGRFADIAKFLEWIYYDKDDLFLKRKFEKYTQCEKMLHPYTYDINIDYNIWKNFSDIEFDRFIDNIFKYYRNNGYPYPKFSLDQRINQYNAFASKDYTSYIDEHSIIIRSPICMSTASSYFPHMFNIKCSTNEMTPLEFFNNNVKFKHMLKKRLRNGYIKNISDSSIRIMTQVYSDTKSVTNFRPSAAAAIYTRYGGLDGVVWDMCAGFGGRLFGAMAAKNIQKYIGTEPSTKTYEGLTNIKNDFEQLSGKQIELHCVGSEDFIPEKESLNLCFTSPPYFDLELYSDESTQSYIKYPTYEEWLNGYMYKTINNCHYGLKKNGYLIINIKNIKHCMNLEQDINNLLIKKFEYIDTLQYCISGKPGKEINYEPVFVYKKFN